jgi:lysophospholipid hydrolase
MSKLWRKIIDLTYPQTAMFSGAGFNYEVHSCIGDKQIEDLWIPYFCITTDLSVV